MKQWVIKVHPDVLHADGLLVINAETFPRVKEIMAKLTNNDIWPSTRVIDNELFFKSEIHLLNTLYNTQYDDTWYVLSVTSLLGDEGFIAGGYWSG